MEAQSYLFVFNSATFGASFALFWALRVYFFFWGYSWGRESDSKHIWNLLMYTINFRFGSAALSFSFIWPNLEPISNFWAFGDYFWGWVRLKNFFGTYLCKHLTLVLEVQPYLFCFNRSHFGPLLHFFWLFGAIFLPVGALFGVGVRIKNIFQSLLMLTINFGFGSTPLSFCFEFSQI